MSQRLSGHTTGTGTEDKHTRAHSELWRAGRPSDLGWARPHRAAAAAKAGVRRCTKKRAGEATGHHEVLRLRDRFQRRVGLAQDQVKVAGAEGTGRLLEHQRARRREWGSRRGCHDNGTEGQGNGRRGRQASVCEHRASPRTPSPLHPALSSVSSAPPPDPTQERILPHRGGAQSAATQRHRPDLQRPTRSVRPPAPTTPTLPHGPCGPRPGPPNPFSALHTGTSRNPFRWSDPSCPVGLSTGWVRGDRFAG
jgi:hypothetical protein